jgi:hypothetical protein
VFEGGPVAAVEDVLALEDIDELIVSTHPEEKSGWLRKKNVLDQLRRLAGDRPFQHVVSDVTARSGRSNVLVIANETVLGEPLLDRIRQRARKGRPASSSSARRAIRRRMSTPRQSDASGLP